MANELTSYFGIVLREKAVVLFYLGSYDGPFSASNVNVKTTMAIYLFGKVYDLPSSNRSAKDTVKRSVVGRVRCLGAAEGRRADTHGRLKGKRVPLVVRGRPEPTAELRGHELLLILDEWQRVEPAGRRAVRDAPRAARPPGLEDFIVPSCRTVLVPVDRAQ